MLDRLAIYRYYRSRAMGPTTRENEMDERDLFDSIIHMVRIAISERRIRATPGAIRKEVLSAARRDMTELTDAQAEAITAYLIRRESGARTATPADLGIEAARRDRRNAEATR